MAILLQDVTGAGAFHVTEGIIGVEDHLNHGNMLAHKQTKLDIFCKEL